MRRLVASVIPLAIALVVASCGGGDDDNTNTPQCEDNVDNDGDGFVDEADPACAAGADTEAEDPATECNDDADNDGDGLIDFPDDPGCDGPDDDTEFGAGTPDCGDGRDNDGDGKVDFPNDPGCLTSLQDNEADDCPDGPNCPECGDGDDNDFDGQTDFAGGDPNCTSASDGTELDIAPNACGTGTSVLPLPASGMVTGTLSTGVSNVMPVQCPGTVGTGPEAAYVLTVAENETIVATTDDPGTTLDTVLYLRRACTVPTTELACSNDISGTNARSTLTVNLQPGTYFLIVDARGTASSGGYVLRVTRYNALGETCAAEPDCAPDHVCRVAAGGSATTCELPVCGDGRDDDGDGDVDFPLDPGCTSRTDDSETDSCPGAGCPACANGLDDDSDGDVDYPDDINCASASATSEFDCDAGGDPVRVFASNVTAQTTAGLGNEFDLSCGTDGRDEVWLLQINTDLVELTVDTRGSAADTAIALRRGSCTGFDLQCDDDSAGGGDSQVMLVDIFAGQYYVVVDDENTSGTYNLNVRGIYANGALCDPASTAFVCGTGYGCSGAPGSATCQPTACNDTVDEDGDGAPGFPSDPGCTSISDDDETDTCPSGAGCPQCADDLDNDMDGFIDYGVDPGCATASQNTELAPCNSVDPVLNFTGNLTAVSGIGSRLNDVALSCGTNGRDDIYRLVIPTPLANLRVDTIGSPLDTVVGVRTATCNGADLQCNDDGAGSGDSLINLTNVGVGEYFIIVEDEFVANPGTYNLNVVGTLLAGGRCTPGSTNFVCPSAHACIGAAGNERCEPAACNDAIDQDGDGSPGFPTDPGCVDINDPDESDDCPAGPGCPQCGNDVNDDGDPWTDYPTDPGCLSANDASELQCTSADPILPAGNIVGATTTGRANDIALSCGSNGRDEVYRFIVNRPLTQLRVDTIGSALDTVVGIRRNSCAGPDLVCDDNSGGSGSSLATVNNPAVGEYYIVVDDRNSANTTYNLNIRATLPNGASCTPGDVTFVCGTGHVCGGTAGMETCIPGPCADTVDQDGDGLLGFPDDPGCTSTIDLTEEDNCPSGPGCPICADDLDNDSDGLVDYPLDPTCGAASDNIEAATCSSADPILTYSGPVMGAAMNIRLNDIDLSCGTDGRDEVYRLVLNEPLLTLRVDTIGSALDTVVGIRRTSCNGTADLVCDDNTAGSGDSLAVLNDVPRGEYWIIVDDRNVSGTLTYNLNITGTLGSMQRCSPSNSTFVCGLGFTCAGMPGAEVCTPGVCNDSVDADGDGFAGYPGDPGCVDPGDGTEADNCPSGPGCPACANDLDDDSDGLVDYPADNGCVAASSVFEVFCNGETDPLGIITQPVTNGTTSGATNNFTPSCQTLSNNDVALLLNVPVPLATLHLDTNGSGMSDTILQLFDSTCGSLIECDDDDSPSGNLSLIDRVNVPAGQYWVSVDGYSTNVGTFTLNVSATVAAGQPCTHPLFASGVLTCTGTCGANGFCQ